MKIKKTSTEKTEKATKKAAPKKSPTKKAAPKKAAPKKTAKPVAKATAKPASKKQEAKAPKKTAKKTGPRKEPTITEVGQSRRRAVLAYQESIRGATRQEKIVRNLTTLRTRVLVVIRKFGSASKEFEKVLTRIGEGFIKAQEVALSLDNEAFLASARKGKKQMALPLNGTAEHTTEAAPN